MNRFHWTAVFLLPLFLAPASLAEGRYVIRYDLLKGQQVQVTGEEHGLRLTAAVLTPHIPGETADQPVILPSVPRQYALLPNYPNPFNPETTLPLAIPDTKEPTAQVADLAIYDALGRVVRVWDLSDWQPGFRVLIWDGLDEDGRPVSSGLYLARLRAGDFHQTRKLLLLR